ncbi:MAG: ABC transporter ATP-binding protein [Patescibacteria group bacterium]
MDNQPIIKLENVNIWYDKGKPSEVQALKNINMEINRGEYVAFFGPSGCGKTTLLYTISGIEQSQDGKILINGRDISNFSKKELAIYRQIGIGIVFQQFNLIPSLTVVNNVALPMAFLGVSQEKRTAEAMQLLERLSIKEFAERYPYELSGGQQQRVGIARALANNPPIIVADEPLGNLDSVNAEKVLQFLKELNEKDGRTIIMVTHEAWSLRDARKIFYMKDGEIIKIEKSAPKTVAETVSKNLYEELSPQLNFKELAAKTLSSMLLRGYSVDEIKRFEFFMLQRFNNKIDADIFRNVLDRPFKDGGIGLWKQKAKKISQYVEEIIEERKTVEEIYKELEKNPENPLRAEIERLRNWLMEEYNGKLSEIQILRLNEIIYERLRSIIDIKQFQAVLNLPRNKFGVGVTLRTSRKISEKLESILGSQNNTTITTQTI